MVQDAIVSGFGRNLSRLWERSGMTQEGLAESSELTWRYLQQLEAGAEANPSLQILCGIKKALACGWDGLLARMP